MAKKRSCRRNEKERGYHERAVTLRKMTDEQLIAHFDRRYEAEFDDGSISTRKATEEIFEVIAGIKGIGAATLAKIQAALDHE